MQSVLFWVTDAQPDKDSQFVTHWLPLSHGPRSTTGTREEEASRYQKRGSQKVWEIAQVKLPVGFIVCVLVPEPAPQMMDGAGGARWKVCWENKISLPVWGEDSSNRKSMKAKQ